jgi:hypothetical protein
MPTLVSVKRSDRKGKKWVAEFKMEDGRTLRHTHFGASGYTDFTRGASEDQRKQYLDRHHKDLVSHDPTSAGLLSYHILWGPSRSMERNIQRFKQDFKLN